METIPLSDAIAQDRWFLRTDNDGEAYGGFRWAPQGERTRAPDWDPRPRCGGGLHGQTKQASGYNSGGNRAVFCSTSPLVAIDREKAKAEWAIVLLVNDLSAATGIEFDGDLDLSGCTGLTALPDGLSVGGGLDLSGCTGLTALPDWLSVGGKIIRH